MIKILSIVVLGTMLTQAQNMEKLGKMLFFDVSLSKNKRRVALPVTTQTMALWTVGTMV